MEEKEPVVRAAVWWRAQRVSLDLRVHGFGSYQFPTVDFEDEQKAPLLCGPLHFGLLNTTLDSLTVQGGWGASVGLSLWQCHMPLKLSLGACLMARAQAQPDWVPEAVSLIAR